MPIEIKSYACNFRCGHRSLIRRSSMEAHEARCFHNPEMMACQTCRHFEPGTRGTHDEPGDEWWCASYEETFDKIGGRKFKCPRWQPQSK